MKKINRERRLYERIYDLVRMIPEGRVATYGQIASFFNRCTPRMVGYAMAALPYDQDVPWHRVINSRGEISPRAGGDGDRIQRVLLEAEGIVFNGHGRVDFSAVGWRGPGKLRR